MKSRLFTPGLRTRTPTALQESETASMFMNPPTHAEIPRFAGGTDFDGNALSLKGTGSPSTPTPGKRIFHAKIHHE